MRSIVCVLCIGLLGLGCAGTNVGAKSVTRSVTPNGKIYKSQVDVVKGTSGALLAKLKEGALGAYAELDEEGTWIVDLNGELSEADATAIATAAVEFAKEVAGMLPAAQLEKLTATVASGASPETIGEMLTSMLNQQNE